MQDPLPPDDVDEPPRSRRLLLIAAATLAVVLLLGSLGAAMALRGPSSTPPTTAAEPRATTAAEPRQERAPDSTSSAITVSDQRGAVEFPDRLSFSAHIAATGKAKIEQVVLEYGVEKLTCSDVVAKAFPSFTPGDSVEASWTWEMRQSGSEPPGAIVWYRWRVRDSAGNEHLTPKQRVTWLDNQHPWQQASRGQVTLHWYEGSARFAESLLDAAEEALASLGTTTGMIAQAPINLYIYGNTDDMRDAILYEPGWTGGQAFPEHDIVIIGISPEQIDWGARTVAHELTHILVGHRTFSCLGNVPTWLNEGIAVYGEGGPEASAQAQLAGAISDNLLISVQALSGNFSEHPGRADLSYAQSYSLVSFLIEDYGKEKLLALFDALAQGVESDVALRQVYGFGLDGFEDRWRESVKAPPRAPVGAASTPTPAPTVVPTFQPATR